MKKKVLILKNDRTGDLFVSLKAINKIINKHYNEDLLIFLSNINHKFSFLFPKIKKKIISMNLNIFDKIKIFTFIIFNKIDTVYILTPKNFYYYLPFFFRNIKFYAITVKSSKSRPSSFLIKYLYRYVVLDRIEIKKRKSSYDIQESLIEFTSNKDNFNKDLNINCNFVYPKKFVFFHYKDDFFRKLLNWDLNTITLFIEFLNNKYEYVCFSSEINNNKINDFFLKEYNCFDFDNYKSFTINKKKIIFLKNIDGYELFNAINKSSKIICPEGIMTHMGYFLQKPILALMHFRLKDRKDFINQIISCKEWFPPNNYEYTVLKKDFNKSISKLIKRI